MAIDYSTLLTDEQKRSILTQRIAQFAAEGYQHQINMQVAEATNNPKGVTDSETAIATIDAAITVNQAALAALPEATTPATPLA